MRKIIQNFIILLAMVFFLANATYAWFEGTVKLVDNVTITTGQLDITVRLYYGIDETLDGTLDYYTEDEANDLSQTLTGVAGFKTFPEDIMEAKGCYMKKHETEEFYYLFRPMAYPYAINLEDMVLTEFYTYLIVIENTSFYRGNIVARLTDFPSTNVLGRSLRFNEQNVDDICDSEGDGTMYFTHQFGSEAPTGGTPKENSLPIERGELAFYPFVVTVPNLPAVDQSNLMNKSILNAHVMIEIEQIL